MCISVADWDRMESGARWLIVRFLVRRMVTRLGSGRLRVWVEEVNGWYWITGEVIDG